MSENPSNSPVLADREREGDTLYFTLWTVFKRESDLDRSEGVAAFEALVEELAADGITLRGIYDVSAMREDADVMTWLHGPSAEKLQEAVRKIRRSYLFAETSIAWSAMGVHREAEFAKDHSPAFARGKEPSEWMTVYPFVRSYDWYLLDPAERGKMLREHGILGRDFPQVLANTVASFALNDFEWMICLEAPELIDLVDMMRHLRYTDARNHVREEIPFYTGRRIGAAEAAEVLR
ncbi:hydrogen peroxide-dependent heme synthase [Zafaria sp. Z1313]|uniref:hydrogen peroxide-dependent heme synthase n=1 Tax=unclassified Zafaria TaxID=2828765 RepID=UPI002E7792DC|nr:hydrogen peroxide-dependent heme synthase [Zafaria sp. J156]MEE1620367.1 hydrogen peroxide-dependent heme synthase [Zafaria sp. J156]